MIFLLSMFLLGEKIMTIMSRFLISLVLMVTMSVGMAGGPTPVPMPYRQPHVSYVHYVDIYPGSLEDNINRLSREYGWPQVVWSVPDDYHWVGHVRVAANNLPDILRNILMNYPLQANFYEGNHVLVITPRTVSA